MFAIEFQAKIKNNVIEIPAEYQQQINQERVKVILLADRSQGDRSQGDRTQSLIGQLLASPLKVDGFTPLQREEIYE